MRLLLAFILLAAVPPRAGAAQLRVPPVAVEVRAGPAWPRGDAGEALGPGPGWGVSASVSLVRTVEAYAGFSRAVLRGRGAGEDRADSGLDLGLGWRGGRGRMAPWARAGLALHEAETQRGGDGADDGRTEVGAALSAGVEARLRGPLSATAGGGWTGYPFGGDRLHADLFRLEVGARLRLR